MQYCKLLRSFTQTITIFVSFIKFCIQMNICIYKILEFNLFPKMEAPLEIYFLLWLSELINNLRIPPIGYLSTSLRFESSTLRLQYWFLNCSSFRNRKYIGICPLGLNFQIVTAMINCIHFKTFKNQNAQQLKKNSWRSILMYH